MRRIELLDYARLAAALAVVAYHYLFSGMHGGKIPLALTSTADFAKYGYLGVNLFFMISGYVIFYTAVGKSAGQFVTSRVVRLYPAFWAAVIFTACFTLFLGDAKSVTLARMLANFTMAPAWLGYKPMDGAYWTLLLELQFYGLVLLLLVLGLQRHLRWAFLLWPVLMLAAVYTGHHRIVYLGGYFSYFAAGALFAVMRERITPAPLVSLGISLYLGVSFACNHAMKMQTKGIDVSPVVVGAIIVAFFAFFFVMNTRRALALQLPGSRLAGGLTYPVYLVHAYAGYMLLEKFATEANRVLALSLVTGFMVLAAWALHHFVEQRPAAFWKRLFSAALGRPVDRLQRAVQAGVARLRGLGADLPVAR